MSGLKRIISVAIEDFKRIDAVSFEVGPGGALITGENAQGKSSVLDAIESALCGARHEPKEPIRRGKKKASVALDLGEYKIEKTWTASGARLSVKSADGATFSRGQETLDGILGKLAFDPMRFMDLQPAEQRDRLLSLVGVDVSEFDARRAEAYGRRRDIGRDLRAAKARLDAAKTPAPGTPNDEVSIAELSRRLQQAMATKDSNQQKKSRLDQAQAEVHRLASLLALAQEELKCAKGEADDLVDPDVDAIRQELQGAEKTNAAVREKKAWAALQIDYAALKQEHDKQESMINSIDEEKAVALAAAKMPIPGLGIDDDGVVYQGLPLE